MSKRLDLTKVSENYSESDTGWRTYNPAMGFGIKLDSSRKYTPEKKTIKILGANDVVFHEVTYNAGDGSSKAIDGLTETIDKTTYPDRAILKLYNGRGFNVYLRSATLDGKLIYQYSGEAGELIHDSLKRDDDIRRNGETVFEIGNEYIVDGTQCAKIADYWYKALGKKKHMYALSIPGSCPWYSVGDWYNLQVGEADTNEYIDAAVECFAVDVERSAGGIGSTNLILRDVEDNWAKTTLYETRLATGGSPKRRVNRSNIVTVASSEYDGTYDYKCDGTDDDVQIQAAIDYVSNTWGGGTIQLTNGAYILGSSVYLKTNMRLIGEGANSIIELSSNSYQIVVGTLSNVCENATLSNFKVLSSTPAIPGFSGTDMITGSYFNKIYVMNIMIDGNDTRSGINLQSALGYGFDSIVSECIFTKCYSSSIALGGQRLRVSDCVISNNKDGSAFYISGGDNIVSGCNFVNINVNSDDGSIRSGIELLGNRNSINGCRIQTVNVSASYSSRGIYVVGDNCTVSNNIVTTCGTGIVIAANADRTVLTNNRSTNNTTANFSDSGTNTTDAGNDWN